MMKKVNKEVTSIVPQKMRSMHSSERIEEMVCELECYRWDAMFVSETWRQEKSEIWETHHKHIFMGEGKYDNRHGVGIILSKKWKQRIIDTEYVVNRLRIQLMSVVSPTRDMRTITRIKLMSVYFTHSRYADHNIENMYKMIEKHTENCKRYIPNVGGDFNAELGLGHGTACTSVARYTLNEGNKRGDWMKHWLMLQDYTALITMYRKRPQKQTTFISPKGNE